MTDIDHAFPRRLGLAMSGGGYRATAYHLGALAYVHRRLLEPGHSVLARLSTVSGGTFTGAAYVLSLADNQPFDAFFSEFSAKLGRVHLTKLWLQHLFQGPSEAHSGRRDVIISAAQTYAEHFYAHPDGRARYFDEVLAYVDRSEDLDVVVFNATEFHSGRAFRFHAGLPKEEQLVYHLPEEAMSHVRMGDIVAASSCLPGAFEPFDFPDDFVWRDDVVPEAVRSAVGASVPIMDGGVYDNQGTEGVVNPGDWDRIGPTRNIDLVIVLDTDRSGQPMYESPRRPQVSSKLRLETLAWASVWLLVLGSAAVLLSAARLLLEGSQDWLSTLAQVVLILVSSAFILATVGVRWAVSKVLDAVEAFNPYLTWRDFGRLDVSQALDMMQLRLSSVAALSTTIFMERIRWLGYHALIHQDEPDDGVRPIITNLIGEFEKMKESLLAGEHSLIPPPRSPTGDGTAVVEVMKAADQMGLTLWFDSDAQRQNVIAAGQIMMCLNLIRFIRQRWGEDPTQYPKDVRAVWNGATEDWTALNENAFSLLPPS